MNHPANKLNWTAIGTAIFSGFAGAILFFGLACAGPSLFSKANGQMSVRVADARSYVGGGRNEDQVFHAMLSGSNSRFKQEGG